MPDRSLIPDERCFPYAQSEQQPNTDNPTAPRGDDPTANEMTLSLRLGGRDGPRRNGAPQADPKAAEAAEAARSFGHFPEEGEQLDARPGHLLVVCGDWLTHEDGGVGGSDMTTGDWKADSLPELVCEGLTSALEAVSGRCVVVCTGGAGLSHAMVSRFVGSVGLDLCGPGRRREHLPCIPYVYTMRVQGSTHDGCTYQGRENDEGAQRRVGIALGLSPHVQSPRLSLTLTLTQTLDLISTLSVT